ASRKTYKVINSCSVLDHEAYRHSRFDCRENKAGTGHGWEIDLISRAFYTVDFWNFFKLNMYPSVLLEIKQLSIVHFTYVVVLAWAFKSVRLIRSLFVGGEVPPPKAMYASIMSSPMLRLWIYLSSL